MSVCVCVIRVTICECLRQQIDVAYVANIRRNSHYLQIHTYARTHIQHDNRHKIVSAPFIEIQNRTKRSATQLICIWKTNICKPKRIRERESESRRQNNSLENQRTIIMTATTNTPTSNTTTDYDYYHYTNNLNVLIAQGIWTRRWEEKQELEAGYRGIEWWWGIREHRGRPKDVYACVCVGK